MTSLLSGIITSKTKIRILMRLFLNPHQYAYLRELSDEFKISPSQINSELKQLQKADILTSKKNGRQVLYNANKKHPLFSDLHSMVKKAMGMDQIVDSIVRRLGKLERAYLLDDYAMGKDTGLIDLLLIGEVDQHDIQDLVSKTEKHIDRKIRTLILTQEEYEDLAPTLKDRPSLLIWQAKEYMNIES